MNAARGAHSGPGPAAEAHWALLVKVKSTQVKNSKGPLAVKKASEDKYCVINLESRILKTQMETSITKIEIWGGGLKFSFFLAENQD